MKKGLKKVRYNNNDADENEAHEEEEAAKEGAITDS